MSEKTIFGPGKTRDPDNIRADQLWIKRMAKKADAERKRKAVEEEGEMMLRILYAIGDWITGRSVWGSN